MLDLIVPIVFGAGALTLGYFIFFHKSSSARKKRTREEARKLRRESYRGRGSRHLRYARPDNSALLAETAMMAAIMSDADDLKNPEDILDDARDPRSNLDLPVADLGITDFPYECDAPSPSPARERTPFDSDSSSTSWGSSDSGSSFSSSSSSGGFSGGSDF